MTRYEEIDITEIAEDCGILLAENLLLEVEIEVDIHGSYRPAILYPNDKACPAEYPEAEAATTSIDLATKCLAFLKQNHYLTDDEAVLFLRAADTHCQNLIELAEEWALEQDEEAPESQYDTLEERDAG